MLYPVGTQHDWHVSNIPPQPGLLLLHLNVWRQTKCLQWFISPLVGQSGNTRQLPSSGQHFQWLFHHNSRSMCLIWCQNSWFYIFFWNTCWLVDFEIFWNIKSWSLQFLTQIWLNIFLFFSQQKMDIVFFVDICRNRLKHDFTCYLCSIGMILRVGK